MKKRIPFIYKVLIAIGLILLLAMIVMIPPVTAKVATWTNTPLDTVRSWAQTAAGIALGAALVTWGIAALAIPILGGIMIIAGLALLAYSVWPLFSTSSTGG
jgi:hypothetical protein